MKRSLLAIISMLALATTTANVYTSGPRLDSFDDSTDEGARCWVDGYDAGFAQKYDKDRADECSNEKYDEYNAAWGYACRDSGLTKIDCDQIKDNPVDIEDHESLYDENSSNCFYDGLEDGKADRPFNEKRSSACSEYGSKYRSAYQSGCESHSTQESCELLIEGEKYYCPDNPDNVACVEFLHNATNKVQGEALKDTVCFQSFAICQHESNPEKYCLNFDDPAFCKTVGDICDEGGFVRPEYPYCK